MRVSFPHGMREPIWTLGERDPRVLVSDEFNIPESHPNADLARAAVIEYLAGDLSAEQLDRDLDFYLLGAR